MQNRINSTQFIHYKMKGKRDSIITLANPATNEQVDFTPNSTLFQNYKHKVRLFANSHGECIIVKSPAYNLHRSLSESTEEFEREYKYNEDYIDREFIFFRKCYPLATPCHLAKGFTYTNTNIYWSFRLIMPYIAGQHLGELISQTTDLEASLSLLLATALELRRIHQLGIIHGDVHHGNVIAHLADYPTGYSIQFIDFENAYTIEHTAAITTQLDPDMRWAPERITTHHTAPKPDFKQDVYSFGRMTIDLMNLQPQFPTLFATIKKSLKTTPTERPSLDEIITDISNEVEKISISALIK